MWTFGEMTILFVLRQSTSGLEWPIKPFRYLTQCVTIASLVDTCRSPVDHNVNLGIFDQGSLGVNFGACWTAGSRSRRLDMQVRLLTVTRAVHQRVRGDGILGKRVVMESIVGVLGVLNCRI